MSRRTIAYLMSEYKITTLSDVKYALSHSDDGWSWLRSYHFLLNCSDISDSDVENLGYEKLSFTSVIDTMTSFHTLIPIEDTVYLTRLIRTSSRAASLPSWTCVRTTTG